MKILYFDLGMGAAGDMISAALYDLLNDEQKKEFEELAKGLGIDNVLVNISKAQKCGINGSHISVVIDGVLEESYDEHEHHHHDEHHHHSLAEIDNTIEKLNIKSTVKSKVKEIYRELAAAESYVHGVEISNIHLHEVGAVDAIVDISLACILIDMLKVDRIYASAVHVGSGKVRCAHGVLPVPTPATAYLLKDIPVYGGKIQGELCTPTGAVLLKHFVDSFGDMPILRISSIGYGMGKKDFEVANCVRALVGEAEGNNDVIYELDFNVDDMTPEEIGFLLESLMDNGARDAFVVPITMKKSRPGHMITVITDDNHKEQIVKAIFKNSSTIGIREKECNRYVLDRKIEAIETKYGTVRKKIASGYGVTKEKYEYDDLAKISRETGLSISEIKNSIE